MPPGSPDKRSPIVVAAYWSTRIMMLAMELALLPLGGFWLDRTFGTRPWLTFAGVCLGLVIAGMDFNQLAKTQFSKPKNRGTSGESQRRRTDE